MEDLGPFETLSSRCLVGNEGLDPYSSPYIIPKMVRILHSPIPTTHQGSFAVLLPTRLLGEGQRLRNWPPLLAPGGAALDPSAHQELGYLRQRERERKRERERYLYICIFICIYKYVCIYVSIFIYSLISLCNEMYIHTQNACIYVYLYIYICFKRLRNSTEASQAEADWQANSWSCISQKKS